MTTKIAEDEILCVRGLRTYFSTEEGLTRAVDGVSFSVPRGKVVGIVGESGCGKSVTIKSILRIVQQPGELVGGEILFRPSDADSGASEPVDLAKLDATGRRMRAIRGDDIALIPQEPMAALSPVHTIGDQLEEAVLLHRKVSRAEAKQIVIKALNEVGMPSPEERLGMYSWELSGGLRQRVMIAMALVCDPELLIADEPTTAIDVTTQAQVLSLLRKLQSEHNLSVIFITHDLGVIAQLADSVVVMYLGRVMEEGPVDAIYHSPLHPYTRALLESVPSVHQTSREPLPAIAGSIPHPFNRPKGCPFHPRCPSFMPGKCDTRTPRPSKITTDQSVACFLHHDLADEDS